MRPFGTFTKSIQAPRGLVRYTRRVGHNLQVRADERVIRRDQQPRSDIILSHSQPHSLSRSMDTKQAYLAAPAGMNNESAQTGGPTPDGARIVTSPSKHQKIPEQ